MQRLPSNQKTNASSCCGATSSCCGDDLYNIMADDYTKLEGYNPDADLGLGCGFPITLRRSKKATRSLILEAAPAMMPLLQEEIVGEKGKIIGIDFTDPMIARQEKMRKSLDLIM